MSEEQPGSSQCGRSPPVQRSLRSACNIKGNGLRDQYNYVHKYKQITTFYELGDLPAGIKSNFFRLITKDLFLIL